jgi:hypothetical protein
VIHLRGLALDTLDLHAADNLTMTLTVQDAQGNKLMRRELLTSQYGIASADFALDAQATSGDYIISAELGPTSSTRTVEVKPYTLPRFEITFTPDKSFYLPGETATGTVEARYFFGKPVAGAAVTMRGSVTDVNENELFAITGETDADGIYRYEFPVPDYFVGQLDNRSAEVDLNIEVIDTANHAEAVDETVTVAEKTLLIDAVPESGVLRPGLENIVYIDVSYPDGTVAAGAVLTITGGAGSSSATAGGGDTESDLGQSPLAAPGPSQRVTTDAYGLATITLEPSSDPFVALEAVADDGRGNRVLQLLLLGNANDSTTSVLLRPDRSQYAVGDTMNLDIFVAGQAQTAYLDIIKDRQTFALVALPVTNGVAQAALPVDGSLLGTLELNAYVVSDYGTIVSDQRLALVEPAPAAIAVSTDAEVYRPGDTASLDIQVTRDGAPMPGAIGLAIVDESVFSVAAQEPGFARTYFLLERELQEPRFEIHDFTSLDDDIYSPYDDAPENIRYGSSEWRVASGDAARGEGRGASYDAAEAQQVALAGVFAQELASQHTTSTREMGNGVATRHSPPAPLAPLASMWGNRIYLAAPLLGLALYDGTRRRRKLLIALVLFSLGSFFWSACGGAPAAPAAAPAAEQAAAAETSGGAIANAGERPPRLRQYFPETLYWMPELETDADGRVQVDVPIADSITTWRITVLASDRDGNLGSAETGLRVFQDFFVEPDLPRFLTVGDEVDVPITIFNYLDEPQSVKLSVAPGDWFEVTGTPELAADIGANEVAAVYLPIRVTAFGQHDLQITANGAAMDDAVVRTVEVLPDGQATFDVANGKLAPSQTLAAVVPAEAVPGTGHVTVKLYPGIVSQIVEGLEGMLHAPYGCFEQTSSATYPNVLVLDYLKRTGQANPRIQLQAEHFINLGYQRLLTFEVYGQPGGFSLFGDPPAQTMLTAYGLMEFDDMGEVAYVDPALVARVVDYLAAQQNGDGSWSPNGATIESGLESVNGQLAATAYIVWGLADAGHADSRAVLEGLGFIEQQLRSEARQATGSSGTNAPPKTGARATPVDTPQPLRALDNYTLALIANAYVASGEDATAVLDRLLASAVDGGGEVYWPAGTSTYLGSYGSAADVETTAMVVQALLRADHALDAAQQGLDYLIGQRDPYGSFYTTQATVQTLKALLLAVDEAGEQGTATVTVTLTDGAGKTHRETLVVDDGNGDVVQQLTFDGIEGAENQLEITVDGERSLQYQVVTGYYLPWEAVAPADEAPEPVHITVRYDRTELEVNDTVDVQAEVELLAPGAAGTLIVDLGIPPGFAPVTADLDRLVDEGQVERYELTGRQIILYLTDVASGVPYRFDYRLQARFPIRAQTPGSQAYDYYAPDQSGSTAPQRINVTLGTPGD